MVLVKQGLGSRICEVMMVRAGHGFAKEHAGGGSTRTLLVA